MSRHRNVRSMRYSDEYDGYDDVYGHSVEDDYSISPSDAAQFMYDRDKRNRNMAAYFDDVQEEDGEEAEASNTEEMVKVESCVDKIVNVIGSVLPRDKMAREVVRCDFDCERACDAILAMVNNMNLNKAKIPLITNPEIEVKPTGTTPVTIGFQVDEPDTKKKPLKPTKPQKPDEKIDVKNRAESPEPYELDNVKPNAEKVDALALYRQHRGSHSDDDKQRIYLIIIGHVDAGKSTLMGHMLYYLGQVNQRLMHKYEQESKKMGKQSFMYAWVLDETGEERMRGITMDIGRSQFETKTKKVILLDAPGHKDFIPNMIAGANQADVALLVVDATRGEFETGFEAGGQTREHAVLVRSLGVSQLAVVVNKMDTVEWSETRYNDIKNKLSMFLKQAGFRDKDVTYVPCSGLSGENLVSAPDDERLKSWYKGSTLIDVIDNFSAPERLVSKPFRLSVNDVYKVIVHVQSLSEPGYISKLIAQLHKNTGDVIKKRPRCLANNTAALVEITTNRAICVETYKNMRGLGRVMLRVSGVTIAAGLVTDIYD